MKKLLWEELKLNKNFKYNYFDNEYKNLYNKTPRATFAWKVLRDKYYSEIYREYEDEDLLIKAGFILDQFSLDKINYYNIDLLTTPFDKLKENVNDLNNPIVLLSTGGFYPIHEGHIKMMEEAKRVLSNDGYDVIGGYLSLSHDDYISTKPYYISDQYERINEGREYLKNNDWLMIDPWESIYVRTPINFTDVIERLKKYLQKYIDKRIKVAYIFGGDNVEFMYCFEKDGIAVCLNRDGYNELFIKTMKIKNDNIYFIDNLNSSSLLSSRYIREKHSKKIISYKDVGNYLIRNESLLPLSNLIREDNKFDLWIIDKQKRIKDDDEYGANYFTNSFLGCYEVMDNRTATKTFMNAAERWTRSNVIEDAAKAEEIRSTIKEELEVKDVINIDSIADKIFKEEPKAKEEFSTFIKGHGLEDEIKVDKRYVEKKLKRVRLKVDTDIDLYISQEAYKDPSKFEIKRNGDGSINMTIKHVINYIEK